MTGVGFTTVVFTLKLFFPLISMGHLLDPLFQEHFSGPIGPGEKESYTNPHPKPTPPFHQETWQMNFPPKSNLGGEDGHSAEVTSRFMTHRPLKLILMLQCIN